MNLSPTTHSPSPFYGVQSQHENRNASETNQRFSAFVFEPTYRVSSATGTIKQSNAFELINLKEGDFRDYSAQFGSLSKLLTSSHHVDLSSWAKDAQNFFGQQKDPGQGNLIEVSEKQSNRWQLLKKLEGTVVSVTAETFTAHFKENYSDVAFIEAEIDLSELQEQDRALAVEGASLVWTISFCWQGGTRKRESSIYFRHLPAWSAEEVAKAQEQVKRITDAIQWE